ncbi:hypothetical protein VF21_09766 [Pseudogymnoascus sp. 05NY08]|nr:hypothetical protein VF21_09766 [Pseudogymnoascus sp. 05NY08]
MANEGVQNSIANVLPTMDYLLHHIKAAREATTIPHLAMMMETAWAKLADYYELTEDSLVYSAATVLNPSFKAAVKAIVQINFFLASSSTRLSRGANYEATKWVQNVDE